MPHDAALASPGVSTTDTWGPPAMFAVKTVGGIALGAWMLTLGPVAGFLAGVDRGSPPPVQPHVHAFLVPYWASFVSAALVGLTLSSGVALRRESAGTRTRAVWTCAGLGVLLAVALYVFLGYVLPVSTRQVLLGPQRAAGFAPDYPPYLLTNGELSSVQAYFRRQGGYSPRLSLMWQLRAWCTLIVPIFALFAAAVVARARQRNLLYWFCLLECGIVVLWLVGTMMAVGPAAIARPTALPQHVAWGLLAALAVLAARMFRRALQALGDEEFEQVLAEIADAEGGPARVG